MKTHSLHIISVVLLLFHALVTQAQIDPINAYNRHVIENWKNDYLRIGQYKVKGSPYLLGEPFPGDIAYASGTKINGMRILYDIHAQQAGVETDGKMINSREEVNEFTLILSEKYGSGKLVFRNSAAYGQPKLKIFLNVLAEGEKVSLLKCYRTKLVSDPNELYAKDLKVFEQYFEYYLYDNASRRFTKVKLRDKDILGALDEQKVQGIISAGALNLSLESDVIKLVNKYNSSL